MVVAGVGAGVTFAVAASLLGAFFATNDERFDRLAEWCFVLFAAFAIALAAFVHQRLEASSDLVIVATTVGVVGVAALGTLELLSALRRIDFQRYGFVGALGFAAWLAWIAGVSAIGLSSGAFTPALGWLGLAAVAAGLLVVGRFVADRSVIRGERSPGLAEMAPLLAVFLAIVAWLVWLGIAL